MKRVSILLATGFEEIEALAPLDVLRRLNYDVELISMTNSYYVKSSHGVDIKADKLFLKTTIYHFNKGLVILWMNG